MASATLPASRPPASTTCGAAGEARRLGPVGLLAGAAQCALEQEPRRQAGRRRGRNTTAHDRQHAHWRRDPAERQVRHVDLHAVGPHVRNDRIEQRLRRVQEHGDTLDPRRHRGLQDSRVRDRKVARRRLVEHETHRLHARGRGGVYARGVTEPAHLDPERRHRGRAHGAPARPALSRSRSAAAGSGCCMRLVPTSASR